jgi:Uncharacterized conserved protein
MSVSDPKKKSADLPELTRKFLKSSKRLAEEKGEESAVHKFRVQSRRLEMYSRYHPELEENPKWEKILKKLKALRRRLGKIREIDVHRGLWKELAGGSRCYQALDRKLSRDREKALENVLDKFDVKAIAEQTAERLEKLGPVKKEQAPSSERLIKRFEKVFESERRFEKKRRLDDLHRVRIAIKKLRYSLEPLLEKMGPQMATFLSWLKKMQDQLGRVHDLVTLGDELGRHQRSCKTEGLLAQELHKASRKLGLAIALGKKNWERTSADRQRRFREFMSENFFLHLIKAES